MGEVLIASGNLDALRQVVYEAKAEIREFGVAGQGGFEKLDFSSSHMNSAVKKENIEEVICSQVEKVLGMGKEEVEKFMNLFNLETVKDKTEMMVQHDNGQGTLKQCIISFEPADSYYINKFLAEDDEKLEKKKNMKLQPREQNEFFAKALEEYGLNNSDFNDESGNFSVLLMVDRACEKLQIPLEGTHREKKEKVLYEIGLDLPKNQYEKETIQASRKDMKNELYELKIGIVDAKFHLAPLFDKIVSMKKSFFGSKVTTKYERRERSINAFDVHHLLLMSGDNDTQKLELVRGLNERAPPLTGIELQMLNDQDTQANEVLTKSAPMNQNTTTVFNNLLAN
jgi:hypothetical protein